MRINTAIYTKMAFVACSLFIPNTLMSYDVVVDVNSIEANSIQSCPIPGRIIICLDQSNDQNDYFAMTNGRVLTKYSSFVQSELEHYGIDLTP
jgi:hypothetical protein